MRVDFFGLDYYFAPVPIVGKGVSGRIQDTAVYKDENARSLKDADLKAHVGFGVILLIVLALDQT